MGDQEGRRSSAKEAVGRRWEPRRLDLHALLLVPSLPPGSLGRASLQGLERTWWAEREEREEGLEEVEKSEERLRGREGGRDVDKLGWW